MTVLWIACGIRYLLKRYRSNNHRSDHKKLELASPHPHTYTSIIREKDAKVEEQYEALSVEHHKEKDEVNLYENFSG